MRMLPATLFLTLIAASAPSAAAADTDTASRLNEAPFVTRVFRLSGMSPRDAMSLLRSEAHLRRVVMVESRSAVVVSDSAGMVSIAEKILKDRGVVERATDPHGPMHLGGSVKKEDATASRVFVTVDADAMKSAFTLLLAIYQMRGVTTSDQDNSVTAWATGPLLDAGEALLKELDLLAGSRSGPEE